MGANVGIHFKTVKDESGLVKCVPNHTFTKFPQELRRPAGSMILETEAYPMKLVQNAISRLNAGDSVYWWPDAQFVPHNDSSFFVTGGLFIPRANRSWVSHSKIPPGRIIKLDLSRQSGSYMNETRMANYPKIQMHPSGRYFLYVSYDCIKIETMDHREVFNKCKDLRSCNYRFCAFSHDGKHLAILLSASKHFEMIISKLDSGFTFHDVDVDLTRMIPKFRNDSYSDHVECKWSPDSQHIVICASSGFLFVLNSKLELVLDIVESVLPHNVYPSWSSTFDYNPMSCHENMAVGGSDRCIYFINTQSQTILTQTDPVSKSSFDCLVYHPKGHCVAIATRDYNIYLIDSEEGELLYQVNMSFHVEKFHTDAVHPDLPAVARLSFTTTGEQIASATSDGYVRVWQLPSTISLFALCKQVILSNVPPTSLHQLPLPSQIVSKLLAMPNML